MLNRRALCGLFAAMLFIAVASAATAQSAGKAQHSVRTKSVTEDLSSGAKFTFTVAPSLPQFTFKVTPERRPPDQWGNPHSTVRDVVVFRGDSKQPFQHLTGCGWSDMEAPRAGADWFRTEDFNFDGYQDIFLMTVWGSGGSFGCVWLYNPATGHFDYSDAFSKTSNVISFDPATRTLVTFWKLGMAGMDFVAEKYQVKRNEPVLIWSERQDWDSGKRQFHCVVQERRGTEMATVRNELSKIVPEESEVHAPCDPSELFEHPAQKRRPD